MKRKKNTRPMRNKKIREDLIFLLSRDGPLTANELAVKLLEINDNRTVSVNSVSQILRVKQFEKLSKAPNGTATWTLSEYGNDCISYPSYTKLVRDDFLENVFKIPKEDLHLFSDEPGLVKLSIWKYITKEQWESLFTLTHDKKYAEFIQLAKEMNNASKKKRASKAALKRRYERYHSDEDFRKKDLKKEKRIDEERN